mgnify:CR=1 FL=1
MKYGIDVSHYQGSIDWNKVKATGKVTFAIMKAMYESSKRIDDTFENNYAGATNTGINRGVYNFIGSVSASDVNADVQAFLKILNGRKLEYGIWLDMESDKVRALGKAKVEEIILKETEIFEKAGYSVGIYCNLDWYKNVLTDKVKEIFKGRLWIARYPKNDKGEVVNNLSPKNSCPESIGWQYSSKGSIDGIKGNVDMDVFWGELKSETIPSETYSRMSVVEKAESWLGKNEADNSYIDIINIYNQQKPLPAGYALKPSDSWCAGFTTAVFVSLGYGSIFPCECSCERMRQKAIEMGIWVESDTFVPQIGDAILYDWQDGTNFATTDNTGWPDHVGIVTYVNTDSGYMVITEGNYSDTVKKRTININGRYIRGYITPKFSTTGIEVSHPEYVKDVDTLAHEVIAGQWGSGETRKKKLTDAGYDYSVVQSRVNEILNTPSKQTFNSVVTSKSVTAGAKAQKIDKSLTGTYTTTANLYMRDGAGTNKKALVLIPKGTKVQNFGYYSVANGVNWLYIQVTLSGITYTGFSSSQYLRR